MIQTQSTGTPPAPHRQRTYDWVEPASALPLLAAASGREYLQRMADREIPAPPVAATLDFDGFEIDGEVVHVTLHPQEFHNNPLGTMHGGVIATLLEHCARLRRPCHPARGGRLHQHRPRGTVRPTCRGWQWHDPRPGSRGAPRTQHGDCRGIPDGRRRHAPGHGTSTCLILGERQRAKSCVTGREQNRTRKRLTQCPQFARAPLAAHRCPQRA